MPAPSLGALSEEARVRMNETARFIRNYDHTPCIRNLLLVSPEEALAGLAQDFKDCQCEVQPALLAHVGDAGLVGVLSLARWSDRMALVGDVGTPWALPLVLNELAARCHGKEVPECPILDALSATPGR